MIKIGVVEDDASVRKLIVCTLESGGFSAVACESAEDFLGDFEKNKAELQLILLDIMLPGMDGLALFERLKERGSDIPVIFLTAKNTELDKVAGLNIGAHDYIAKPFGVLELIARVKATLRNAKKKHNGGLSVGIISMDAAKRKVNVGGKPVELTFKEFEMLRYFMENIGIVLTREIFLEKIWGTDASIETRTVDMHIKTLRSKLMEAGDYIKTVRSVGYELSPAEVK